MIMSLARVSLIFGNSNCVSDRREFFQVELKLKSLNLVKGEF